MPRALIGLVLAWTSLFLSLNPASAQTVWSGLSFEFTRPNDVDFSQPQFQDRITDNVWLTRSVQQGIFNIRTETSYESTSPANTMWATGRNNPGKSIAATNWQNLTFAPWINAYGGMGGTTLPSRLLGTDAVVHLVADDIYLDLRFMSWTSGALGGGFSYMRAEGDVIPPGPTGDYNENGVVDAADYVLWRDTLTQTATPAGSGADGDMSGTVDSADYEFWQARFGNLVPIPGAGASVHVAAAVPEPSTCVTLLIGALLLRLGHRATQSRTLSGGQK